MTEGKLTKGQHALYFVVSRVLVGFSRLFWRLTVEGKEHVPETGPFILAPVHRSNVDSPIVAACTRVTCGSSASRRCGSTSCSASFFDGMGGIPVNRGTPDRDSLRRCVEALEAGEPLVIFPEGSRRSGPIVDELFEGVSYVATKTGAPIIPVGIGGSEQAMPKGAKMLRPVKSTSWSGRRSSPR